MFTENFFEVLKHEGAVSITSWGNDEPHVNCTWNSYLVAKGENILLIPAAGMHSTEQDVAVNDKVILTLATREVEGFNGYHGTGFRINGTAKFLVDGAYFDEMKKLFPFLRSVLQITVTNLKQLL